MEKIIDNFPMWSLGISAIIIAIGFFIIMIKKGFSLKTKGLSIVTNDPDNLYLIFKRSIFTTNKIAEIEYRKRLEEQMSYATDKLECIKEISIKTHRHLLKSKGIIENIHSHPQLRIFELISYILLDKIKITIRRRFFEMTELFSKEENQDDDYQIIKSDFEAYTDRVAYKIIQDSKNIIIEEWIDNDIISRDELYITLKPVLDEIEKYIRDILFNGVLIQLKFSRIKKKMDKEINDFIQETFNKNKKLV